VYANPFDPTISPFFGLGIWLSLTVKKETFVENHSFFLGVGKNGSATHCYCSQLSDMLKDFVSEVAKLARPDRTKSHGMRKGSAIHSTSGTTMPPLLPYP
jgi:citrate lyase alpha subunit